MRPGIIAEITPALPADAAALILLLSRDETNGCHHPPPCGEGWDGAQPDVALNHLRRRIALGTLRIARFHGRPAGFIDRTGENILSLYIAPHARRHGLARALVADAKEATSRLTATCPAEDSAARAFWAAQGFAPATLAAGQPDAASLSRLIWNGTA
jgi:GNAT superfamily N-acetyltransferase